MIFICCLWIVVFMIERMIGRIGVFAAHVRHASQGSRISSSFPFSGQHL